MCSVLRRDGLSVTISPALEKTLSDGTGSRGMSNGRPNLGVLRNPGPDSISNLIINKLDYTITYHPGRLELQYEH
jgi:hypothetical protein